MEANGKGKAVVTSGVAIIGILRVLVRGLRITLTSLPQFETDVASSTYKTVLARLMRDKAGDQPDKSPSRQIVYSLQQLWTVTCKDSTCQTTTTNTEQQHNLKPCSKRHEKKQNILGSKYLSKW